MFTVIIISKCASDLLREYRFLFKPFVDNETIAFCDWNESGTDVASSVPDLYNIVKGKKQWRALILNTDSVYDYRGAAHPGKQNPFDYTEADPETMPHESPIPVIRLTHIIGGYSTTPVKNFEKGFEFVDEETGEKRRVREADLTEEEVHALSLQYGDMVTDIYMEKEEPEELYLRQQALSEKYAFSDIRPSEILLVATRKKTEGSEKARIIESWRNRLEMSSSCFWERNKYPNNCRFLFYDITNSDNSLYTKELTEFWLSVLTLAINKIPASTLQAYRLYRIGVDVSRDKLETGLNLHLNKLDSAYGFIKEQLRLKPEYSFDEDEELVHRQVVPVAIEKSEGRELLVDIKKIGLSSDCPTDEAAFWNEQIRQKKTNLEKYLKAPRRAIDKSANILKAKSEGFLGENYELDRFQLCDLAEILEDLESKILSFDTDNVVDSRKIEEGITKLDKTVKKELSFRMKKKQVVLSGLLALFLCLCGFLPYLIMSARRSSANLPAALALTLGVLAISALGGLIALFLQRSHMIGVMKPINELMRSVAANINNCAAQFEDFFSNICTYMKARSVLDGARLNNENAVSAYSLLGAHKRALRSAMEREREWLSAYGIKRMEEMVPNVTMFFRPEVLPMENSLYYFTANMEDNDIPLNAAGDFITSPYSFVEKLTVEREDIFEEEEVSE